MSATLQSQLISKHGPNDNLFKQCRVTIDRTQSEKLMTFYGQNSALSPIDVDNVDCDLNRKRKNCDSVQEPFSLSHIKFRRTISNKHDLSNAGNKNSKQTSGISVKDKFSRSSGVIRGGSIWNNFPRGRSSAIETRDSSPATKHRKVSPNKDKNVPVRDKSPNKDKNVPVRDKSPNKDKNVPVRDKSPNKTKNVPDRNRSPITNKNITIRDRSPIKDKNLPVRGRSPNKDKNVPNRDRSPIKDRNVPIRGRSPNKDKNVPKDKSSEETRVVRRPITPIMSDDDLPELTCSPARQRSSPKDTVKYVDLDTSPPKDKSDDPESESKEDVHRIILEQGTTSKRRHEKDKNIWTTIEEATSDNSQEVIRIKKEKKKTAEEREAKKQKIKEIIKASLKAGGSVNKGILSKLQTIIGLPLDGGLKTDKSTKAVHSKSKRSDKLVNFCDINTAHVIPSESCNTIRRVVSTPKSPMQKGKSLLSPQHNTFETVSNSSDVENVLDSSVTEYSEPPADQTLDEAVTIIENSKNVSKSKSKGGPSKTQVSDTSVSAGPTKSQPPKTKVTDTSVSAEPTKSQPPKTQVTDTSVSCEPTKLQPPKTQVSDTSVSTGPNSLSTSKCKTKRKRGRPRK